MTTVLEILADGLFAAIAGIGFGAISNPPRTALIYCGVIAAAGHMARFCLINLCGMHLVPASLAGALAVGLLAIICARKVKCPPETFAFPALLPMIPGIYAYRTVQAFFLALTASGEEQFNHFLYICESNGIICTFTIICMVTGSLIPIYMFKKISFSVTR